MKKLLIIPLILILLISACKAPEAIPETVTETETEAVTEQITETEFTGAEANKGKLRTLIGKTDFLRADDYVNFEIIAEPLEEAKRLLSDKAASQTDCDIAAQILEEAMFNLSDGSMFPRPENLSASTALPDIFKTLSGKTVSTEAEYNERMEELRNLYQYYMYGFYPDTSGEKISYTNDDKKLNISIEKDDKKVSFEAEIFLPDPSVSPIPEGGYPVIIAFLGIPTDYAVKNGYAVISFNTAQVASDNSMRTGIFYELYPYGKENAEQTGALMAWTWGAGKVIDALENGFAVENNLSTENIIMTGVSRWGKAAAVAGAFDERIKITMPACSGAAGLALFRYGSEGKSYDYSSLGESSEYILGQNEPLSSLLSADEGHWFNNMFGKFDSINRLPFDQHCLAALCSTNDRYLFIISAYIGEDWTNPPSMYGAYLAAQKAFDYVGNPDNIAINIHKQGHAVLEEDLVKLIEYLNFHLYGEEPDMDLSELKTCLYGEGENYYEDLDKLVSTD